MFQKTNKEQSVNWLKPPGRVHWATAMRKKRMSRFGILFPLTSGDHLLGRLLKQCLRRPSTLVPVGWAFSTVPQSADGGKKASESWRWHSKMTENNRTIWLEHQSSILPFPPDCNIGIVCWKSEFRVVRRRKIAIGLHTP